MGASPPNHTKSYFKSGEDTFKAGLTIETGLGNVVSGTARYKLRKKITIQYYDWQGSGASIYLKDPILNRIESKGPNLGINTYYTSDIAEAESNLLIEHAQLFHRLRIKNEEAGKLESADAKTYRALSEFLEAA